MKKKGRKRRKKGEEEDEKGDEPPLDVFARFATDYELRKELLRYVLR